MALTLSAFACAILIGLNVFATRRIAQSAFYERHQKRVQYAMVWIVPIVGALLAMSLARGETFPRITTDLSDQIEKHDVDLRLNSAAAGGGGGEGSGHD